MNGGVVVHMSGRRLRLAPKGTPVQTGLITVILAVFGIDLVVQSERWGRTPAYELLLQIASADTWGYLYIAAALLMLLSIMLGRRRLPSICAHTLMVALLAMWEFAFFVRWITDPAKSTTIVNVVSWGTFVFLTVWSALLIDRPVRQ